MDVFISYFAEHAPALFAAVVVTLVVARVIAKVKAIEKELGEVKARADLNYARHDACSSGVHRTLSEITEALAELKTDIKWLVKSRGGK